MSFCNKCGAELAPDFRFCEKCGSPVSITAASPTSSTTPVNNSKGKAEYYTLPPGKTTQGMADTVSSMLNAKNMNVQVIHTQEGDFIVQARDKGGKWKQFIGMDVALSIIIKQADSNTASLEFSQAKWIDKGGVMALSMFVLWPLAVTSGIGMYMQGKLPGEIRKTAAAYVNS